MTDETLYKAVNATYKLLKGRIDTIGYEDLEKVMNTMNEPYVDSDRHPLVMELYNVIQHQIERNERRKEGCKW